MRRWAWIVIGVCAAGPAHGDDGPEVSATTEAEAEPPVDDIDPLLAPLHLGLGAQVERDAVGWSLGRRTRIVVERIQWTNVDDGPLPSIDLPGRGWQGGLQLSHDFGWFRLDVSSSLNEIDMQLGRQRHVDVGLSISRTWRLSRWMTAWIALSAGHRRWLGPSTLGEGTATAGMLTIGTTFR